MKDKRKKLSKKSYMNLNKEGRVESPQLNV